MAHLHHLEHHRRLDRCLQIQPLLRQPISRFRFSRKRRPTRYRQEARIHPLLLVSIRAREVIGCRIRTGNNRGIRSKMISCQDWSSVHGQGTHLLVAAAKKTNWASMILNWPPHLRLVIFSEHRNRCESHRVSFFIGGKVLTRISIPVLICRLERTALICSLII